MNKLPKDWEEHFDFQIYDPDGWRFGVKLSPDNLKPQSMDIPISEFEFLHRAIISTINNVGKFPIARYTELVREL